MPPPRSQICREIQMMEWNLQNRTSMQMVDTTQTFKEGTTRAATKLNPYTYTDTPNAAAKLNPGLLAQPNQGRP